MPIMDKNTYIFTHYRLFVQHYGYRIVADTETLTGSSICFFQSFNH